MRAREGGGFARSFGVVLVAVMVVGLLAVVGYLLSELNRRQYRLVIEDSMLVVQRGRYLPFGFERYTPEVAALEAVYQPVPVPPGETLGGTWAADEAAGEAVEASEVFEDRADLDRALFALLAGWTRRALKTEQPEALRLAETYVQRLELLPGVSEEQRGELRTLRADVALQNGQRLLGQAGELLQQAREAFESALRLGTSQPREAQRWLQEVKARIRAYEQEAARDSEEGSADGAAEGAEEGAEEEQPAGDSAAPPAGSSTPIPTPREGAGQPTPDGPSPDKPSSDTPSSDNPSSNRPWGDKPSGDERVQAEADNR